MSPMKSLLALFLSFFATVALAAGPVEGRDYIRMQFPQPVDTADKVEVIEFFWYGCPHCAEFEPLLRDFVKKLPADVAFRKVPAVFRDSWAPGGRLFYTLEAMGLLDKMHEAVFHAVHREKMNIQSDDKIADWVAKQGVDRKKFTDMYRSFTVSGKLRRSMEMTQEYGFGGVPVIVVGGKYMTTGAGTYADIVRVTEALIARNRAEIKK